MAGSSVGEEPARRLLRAKRPPFNTDAALGIMPPCPKIFKIIDCVPAISIVVIMLG